MSEFDLNPKQKLLLKKVRKLEKPTNGSLHQDSDVEDLNIKKRTVGSLMRKLEDKKLVDSSRPKNSKIYELTSKGDTVVDRILERERQKLEKKREDLTEADMVDEFERYFSEDENRQKELSHAGIGRDYVELDVERLLQFNVELGEKLLEEPEKVFEACRKAVMSFPEVNDSKNIRPVNIPDIDTKTISELVSGDIEQLVSVEGVIQSVSGAKSHLTSAIFECSQCGDRYERDQRGNKQLKSPYKCACDSRKFETVEKVFQTVRLLHIKEKPDQASRDTITVIVEGDLAEDSSKNLDALGSGIKVYGYLENYKQKKSADYYEHRLKAKNIEIEQDKWDEIEVTEKDIEKLQEISDRDNLPEHLRQSLAHEQIVGMELLKEAFLLFPLSRTEHTDANTHFLCIGDPGTGKSHLASIMSEAMPRVLKTTLSSGSTKVGLTGAVLKNEVTDQFEAESGAIPMSDGGFHITDEIDKPARENSDLLSAFNEPLSDKKVTLNKANIHTELSADVSEFAIGNPKGRTFHTENPKYEQNPIEDADLNSRFPIKLAVQSNSPENGDSKEKEKQKAWKILNRGSDGDSDEELMPTEQVIKYLVHAQDIEPELPENIKEQIISHYLNLWENSTGSKTLADARFLEALVSISVAYAKMHLSEKVTEKHVRDANDFLKRCYESLDFYIGKHDVETVNDPRGSKEEKVMEKIQELSNGGKAEVQEVIEKSSVEDNEVEDIIERLKREGDLFRPKPGAVKQV